MKIVLSAAVSFAVLGGIWIAQPRTLTMPAFASEVRAAIQHANTWHFAGWRIVAGQKVKWEIWGRRQPFFYREQIGDDVLIDNGAYRLRLLPPDKFQKKGYAIALPSQRLPLAQTGQGSGASEQFIEGIGGDYLNHLHEQSRTSSQVVLAANVENGISRDEPSLTIDAHTHLPVRYHLDRANMSTLPSGRFADAYGPKKAAAELEMNYDGAVPAELANVTVPATYQQVTAADGLVLHPRILQRGANGRIHVRIDHTLAGKPLETAAIYPWFHSQVDLRCPPETQVSEAQYPTDDTGRRYRPDSGNPNHPGYTDFWLTPIDPARPDADSAPRIIRIPVVANLTFAKAIPDPNVTAIWTQIPIASTRSTLSVPMP